ncbi:hypothetical protein GCM10009841_23590 [Microlunatus panaciterrae]|uniref:Peptide/nickel transport system substrate-binding protein n=1 Tax=Microlunatus panaciterrae TaxID=400768 RepID=A0ABS2RE09_9ACTN|nr:ABC transporter substrate-binding protein [Microlunatus panaciterrae]MBM7797240.1 peptide/nickel transport system substrate-binding protein [Microlunatus panaciterrae]
MAPSAGPAAAVGALVRPAASAGARLHAGNLGQARNLGLLLGLTLALLLSACTPTGEKPGPTPSGSEQPVRPFTVLTTDRITVADPAAITDAGSAVIAQNAFQRLMTAEPGQNVLKPDAARDCIFEAAKVYVCTLNEDLSFHNGHKLTSSDVKFSIERATRLAVPGSSASLLSSLRRIETPDPLTIRFVLSREDTQFGWALASPAASIVDEELYDADEIRPPDAPIVGSGPFVVTSFTSDELQLAKYADYLGKNPARMPALVLRTAPDSATIEEAMKAHTADVVWRGLSTAAVTRLTQQVQGNPEKQTTDGYTMTVLPGVRVHQLLWNAHSAHRSNADLRRAISAALQEDRTLDSIVPNGVVGHVPSFELGGKAVASVTWSRRIQLTLGYDSAMPDGRDLANQVRTRLEDTGGLSVRLRPDATDTDLLLLDRKAWTATAMAWLQPYLDAPLPASSSKIRTSDTRYRAAIDDATAMRELRTLQSQAVTDAVMLPMTQRNEYLFARAGVQISDQSFGPGWQLGLFGMKG